MSASESASSDACIDEIDEFKCQSCGQLPICLNSTGNGHEVCDDCLPLWKLGIDICPLLTCKLPSHMADNIRVIKEDLEICKCSNNDAIKEVKGQVMSVTQNFDELSIKASEMETNVRDVQTEVSRDVQEMRMEISKEMRMEREMKSDLQSKMDGLMSKVSSLENESKGLKKKMNERAEEYENLKMENEKLIKQNGDLKMSFKKVEDDFKDFQSSVTSKTDQMKEKLFLMDYSQPQLDFLQMNSFNLKTQYDKFQPVLSWTIKGIKEKMEQKVMKEWSYLFELAIGQPVKTRAKLELKNDDKMYVSLHLEDTNQEDEKSPQLPPMLYYLLKTQKPNENPQHKIVPQYDVFPSLPKRIDSGAHFLVDKKWLTNRVNHLDDSLILEMFVETPERLHQQVHSRHGLLNWALKEYEKKQLMFVKDQYSNFNESPYFYTAPKGYRVQVLLAQNGLEEHNGKGPSAFITFLPGEYDGDLPRSFPHRTTVTLFNPKEPERSVVKTMDEDIENKSFYRVDICEANELTNLIQNDTLYVRVNIVKTVK